MLPRLTKNRKKGTLRLRCLPLYRGRVTMWLLVAVLCTVGLVRLPAQSDVPGDPTSTSGDFNGMSTTGSSLDPYTGNVKRTITDVVVPGTAGTIPLQFTRIYNSRTNVVPTPIGAHFGDANWRHNYQWEGQITTNSSGNTVYQVGYPDGRVINFRLNRPSQVSDPFARGPVGLADRFEVSPSRDPSHHYLHLGNGSQVIFSVQQDASGKYDLLRAERVLDPYGAATTLIYGTYTTTSGPLTVNVLSQIVEPGGRSLNLSYGTQYITGNPNSTLYVWAVITGVSWQDTLGTVHNDAAYGYYVYGTTARPNELGQTTIYCALNQVTYSQTQASNPQTPVSASYTYYAANNSGTIGSAPPLLVNANDPFFAGPMHRIHYAYAPAANNGVWGIVQAEQNYSTNENVASLSQSQPNTPSSATETRGDSASNNNPISRSFDYGESKTAGEYTNAQSFQATTTTDFQGNLSHFYYNALTNTANGAGYLAQMTDPTGASTYYSTEPFTGKVTQVTLPDQRTRQTTWAGVDPTSNEAALTATNPYFVTSTTDERGQVTTYHRYPNTGYVNQIDYPDGTHEIFKYQSFGGPYSGYYKVASYTNKLGALFTYHYGQNDDAKGPADLLKSITRAYTDAAGTPHTETVTYAYNPQNRVQTVTDQRGVQEKFSYNARGLITRVQHSSAPGQPSINYVYNDAGDCTSISDELTHVTTLAYDEYRRVTSVTQPVNTGGITTRTVNFTYDRRDNTNAVIGDALSHTSSAFSYTVLPSGRGVQHVYSPNGWLTDEYSGQTNNNLSGLVFSQCLHEKSIGYDALGRQLQLTDVQGHTWMASYDTCGRPVSATDPLGHVTTATYYQCGTPYVGLLQGVSGPGNNSTATATTSYTAYDALGRLTGWVDPQGNAFGTAYDAAGDVAAQSDGMPSVGNGAHPATLYTSDQLGRPGKTTYADGTYQQWSYDASGNLASYHNRRGNTQTFNAYDQFNRPTGFQWDDGTGGAGITFDAAGRCTFFSNGYSELTMTYDDSNALLTEQQSIGSSPNGGPVIKYTPDSDGNVAQVTYPSGDVASWGRDYLNRIDTVSASLINQGGNTPQLASYVYDGDWLSSRSTCAGVVTGYAYQNNNRIKVVAQSVPASGRNISHRTYGYYPNGQMSGFNKDANGGTSVLENNTGDVYFYQAGGQLNSAQSEAQNVTTAANAQGDSQNSTASNAQWIGSYAYDAAGNRTYDWENGALTQPTYDAENREISYSFDGNGNVTTGVADNGIWQYTYNAFGQLLTATPEPATTPTASFVYDPLGRLCQRVINGVVTNLYYAGNQLVEERDANGNKICIYLYGEGGERVCRLDANYVGTFYHYDARGFTTHLTDLGANVNEQYIYDAWGEPMVYDATGTQSRGNASQIANNRFLWAQGYEWYPELGLYRCGARFYDPTNGRFLQTDPIGQNGGLNIYRYCDNDPINGSDPDGLDGQFASNDGVVVANPNDDNSPDSANPDPNDADEDANPDKLTQTLLNSSPDSEASSPSGGSNPIGAETTQGGTASPSFTSGGDVSQSAPQPQNGNGGSSNLDFGGVQFALNPTVSKNPFAYGSSGGRQPNMITFGTVLPNGRTVGSYVHQVSNAINNAARLTSTPYGPVVSYAPGYSPLSIPRLVYTQTNFKINFHGQANAAFLGDAGNFAYAAISARIGVPLGVVEAVAGGYALWARHPDANGPFWMDMSARNQILPGYNAGWNGN